MRVVLLGISKRRDQLKAVVLVRLKATKKYSTRNHLLFYADRISGEGGFAYLKSPRMVWKKTEVPTLRFFRVFCFLACLRNEFQLVPVASAFPV